MAILDQRFCVSNTTCAILPLAKRKVVKKIFSEIIAGIIFVIIFFLLPLFFLIKADSDVAWLWGKIAIFFLLIIILYASSKLVYQIFYFRNYFYDLKENEIVIKKGVISRTEISLPYLKIQNIYVDQDILDRLFRLYDVHFETAGLTSGFHAHIDGLNEKNATTLKKMVMDKLMKINRSDSPGVV